MTEPVHPPDSPTPLFGSAAELLTRITTQLGTQLSGVRPPRARPAPGPTEPSHAAHPRRRGPRQS